MYFYYQNRIAVFVNQNIDSTMRSTIKITITVLYLNWFLPIAIWSQEMHIDTVNSNFFDVLYNNQDSANAIAQKARQYYSGTGSHEEALALKLMGIIKYFKYDNDSALFYYNKSIKLYEKHGDSSGVARNINNMAIIEMLRGNTHQASKYYFRALKIHENNKDTTQIVTVYNNLGNLYRDFENYEQSFLYHQKALNLMDNSKDIRLKSSITLNLGTSATELGRTDTALILYQDSYRFAKMAGDSLNMGKALTNMGNNYFHQGDVKKALSNHLASIDIFTRMNSMESLVGLHQYLAKDYAKMNQHPKVIFHYKEALNLASKHKLYKQKQYIYENLTNYYARQKQFNKAFHTHLKYTKLRDSLYSIEKQNAINELMTKYDAEKKNQQIALLEKENTISEIKIRRQRLAFIFSVIVVVLAVVLLIALYRAFRIKRKANRDLHEHNAAIEQQKEEISAQRDQLQTQNDEIQKLYRVSLEQKKEIDDSIRAATNIQYALLPSKIELDNLLQDHFILFRPKHAVSGDFFWSVLQGNQLAVTVSDCTGHGVPGAFMSMLGISFLNEIFRQETPKTAAEVLMKLREFVIQSMKHSSSKSIYNEGMDIGFILLNTETLECQFAGAHNPLWIVRNNALDSASSTADIVEEIKGDKMPIGDHPIQKEFTNHTIQLQKGDKLYLFSDGFADQFGGPKGRKYKHAPFKNLIAASSNEPMHIQKQKLESELISWMDYNNGAYDQIDDITVMGITIS